MVKHSLVSVQSQFILLLATVAGRFGGGETTLQILQEPPSYLYKEEKMPTSASDCEKISSHHVFNK